MISVLYEDEDFLVVDKPEGIASIPERSREKASLLTELETGWGKLFVVHRLDKEVSGVIVFAKHAAAHKHLNEAFSARNVHKTYEALAHGAIRKQRGTIDQPIRQFGSGRMGVDTERGKPSLTRYQVVERFAHYTHLDVLPETGRRHQIRVHLYSIGHPIVGDLFYGDNALQRSFPRVMLHARAITFRHLTGQLINVASHLPESFSAVLRMAQVEPG